MTIERFLESAKAVKSLAKKHFGKYMSFYSLERLDCGNIEFSVPKYKEKELLEIVPDDTTDFPLYMQFCYYDGEWHHCMSNTIQNVGLYKKQKGWSENGT